MLLLHPCWPPKQVSHSTSVILRNLIYKSEMMLGGCLSNWGLWQIVVMPSKLTFFPLPLIRKRESVFHLYLALKDIPSLFGGSGGRVGGRDVSQAYRYRYMYEKRLDWCRKEKGTITQWLD